MACIHLYCLSASASKYCRRRYSVVFMFTTPSLSTSFAVLLRWFVEFACHKFIRGPHNISRPFPHNFEKLHRMHEFIENQVKTTRIYIYISFWRIPAIVLAFDTHPSIQSSSSFIVPDVRVHRTGSPIFLRDKENPFLCNRSNRKIYTGEIVLITSEKKKKRKEVKERKVGYALHVTYSAIFLTFHCFLRYKAIASSALSVWRCRRLSIVNYYDISERAKYMLIMFKWIDGVRWSITWLTQISFLFTKMWSK